MTPRHLYTTTVPEQPGTQERIDSALVGIESLEKPPICPHCGDYMMPGKMRGLRVLSNGQTATVHHYCATEEV